jgi:Tfp pilus assembly protein PilO
MNLRLRDRIILGVVLVVALAGAYYLLALSPERQKAKTLATAVAGQRTALTTAQSNYAVGRAAQASIKADAPEWAALHTALPNTSNIPALLRVLERNADAVNVKMQAITLTDSASTAAGPVAPVPSTGGATTIPLQLTFAGGYIALHNLVRRLDGLVVLSRGKVHATGPLLSIGSVSLSETPKLTVQLTAEIYQLNAASAAATTPTGGQ